jgi:hypothetical protein
VHVIEIEFAMTVPEQLWGPLNVSVAPVTVPVKPLNGAAKESEQSVCVTTAFCPMSDASQCAVTVHVPDTSEHAALLPSGDVALDDEEVELHAHARQRASSAARKIRGIRPCYMVW